MKSTMKEKYLLADETISKQNIDELIAWLKTGPWLTQGALVREFERRWGEWLPVKHSVFVNSGSSANLLMYDSVRLSGKIKNKKVIVPAVCWPTSVAPAIQLGFEPIVCDADPDTLALDPEELERLLRQTGAAAVVMVHILGVPANLDAILKLKKKFGFILMEDSCAATGSEYDSRRVGTFGDISTFSFFYGHHLSTIEGGMVCTVDDELHDILLQIRSHGWAKDLPPDTEAGQANAHHAMEFNRPFTFYYPGYNVRSADLNARIGLSQLAGVDTVIRRRIENHAIYQSRFQDAGFDCQKNPKASICSIAFAGLAKNSAHRDRIAVALRDKHIETRPIGVGNLVRQPFWPKTGGRVEGKVADRVYETGFQLPNHPKLSPDDIHYICDTVLEVE